MDRQKMIESLTEYELGWLLDNSDKHSLAEMSEFFSKGGFNIWTNEELEAKYNFFIAEEA